MSDRATLGRREFIKRAGTTILAGVGIQGLQDLINTLPAYGNDSTAGAYKIAEWTGDDFRIGHQLRAHQLPEFPKHAEREVDFVIVGGGISGLAAAHHLRHHNFLLLEQYESLGGQSRGSSIKDLGFSYGAASVGAIEGELAAIVSDFNLHPVKFEAREKSWLWENQWVSDIVGSTKPLYSEYKRLKELAQPVWTELKKQRSLIPFNDTLFGRLDQSTFASALTGFDPKFVSTLDAYLQANNCLGVQRSSALAAYATIQDLAEPINAFAGGNQVLTTALASAIVPERCINSAFVWSVEVGEKSASVVYSTADGAVHRVNCRFAIVCTLPMISGRILNSVSDQARAAMLSFKYGSYLVANLVFRSEVFASGAYDNWVQAPKTFSNIIRAEKPYQAQGHYRPTMGSILTVYQPYEPGSVGRPSLLAGDRQAFAESVVSQLTSIFGNELTAKVELIVLSRWGHSMAVPSTGFFTRVSHLHNTVSGAYTLGHCSSQGLASAESALNAARHATNQALSIKSSAFVHFPNIPTKT